MIKVPKLDNKLKNISKTRFEIKWRKQYNWTTKIAYMCAVAKVFILKINSVGQACGALGLKRGETAQCTTFFVP